jgi:hypothetical protein
MAGPFLRRVFVACAGFDWVVSDSYGVVSFRTGSQSEREPSAYELLGPKAALGFVLYLNVLMLGFVPWSETNSLQPLLFFSSWTFVALALVLLRSRERVRERVESQGAQAAGWMAALWPAGYLALCVGLVGTATVLLIRHFQNPGDFWSWPLVTYEVAFVGVWLVRDALYLQWMRLRRARRSLASALLYLIVFYVCTAIVFGTADAFGSARGAATSAAVFPSALFLLTPSYWQQQETVWIAALAVQLATALLFAWLQRQKLQEFLPEKPATTIRNEAQPQNA